MLIITNPRTMTAARLTSSQLPSGAILDPYSAMLEDEPIAWIFIIQPGDDFWTLAKLRGQPFELWELIARRDGWFEAVFVLLDDGFGHVVLIPDCPTIDETLLAICREHAVAE